MFRLIASALIALIAISTSLAHAQGGASPAGVEAPGHAHAPHPPQVEAMGDHGDNAPAPHEDHAGACVFGHCATACGVILPFHPTVASATFSAAIHEYTEETLVGLMASADPPPPKS